MTVAGRLVERGSVAWRVNREPALLLGGGRALLMQVAHPAVAAGVADHSDFQRDPLGRLRRTLELSLALTFGAPAEVELAARQIRSTHARVRGHGYRADDPDLLLWVHATLIDSALLTYRTFVADLDEAAAAAYYRETQPIGSLLGIPPARFPASLGAFRRYVAEMLAGPVRPDANGRRLAVAVLRPPIRFVPGFAFAPLGIVTAGLLPASLRAAYGLRWNRLDRAAFAAARTAIRTGVRVTPGRLRAVPPARAAERQT
jgi:uncharacterized protein (DUF2236 family)